MTLLEKVLLVQVAIQTPAVIFLCVKHGEIMKALYQLKLKVFYKVEGDDDWLFTLAVDGGCGVRGCLCIREVVRWTLKTCTGNCVA